MNLQKALMILFENLLYVALAILVFLGLNGIERVILSAILGGAQGAFVCYLSKEEK